MHGTAPGERWFSGGSFCARVRTAGALTPRRFASSVLHQQKNRLKGRTAEGREMIRACACGAKLFAALEYEQPGRLRPAGSRLQFSANKKKPPERQGGGRRGDDQGLRLRRKTLRCARVRTAGALTPRRPAFSVLRQQKKPPERQDGGRRGDDQGLRLRRKTRFASTNSRGAYAPPVRVFSSSPTKKTA